MTFVVVVAVLVVVGLVVLRMRSRARPADQVDAFAAARSVTNRWSADPTSAPAPVRDYVAQQSRPVEPEA